MVPAIIEVASVDAYCLPSFMRTRPSVASATDGAAPNSPAKLFGLKTSPRTEKNETAIPPIRKRSRSSFMLIDAPELLQAFLKKLASLLGSTRPQNAKFLPPFLVVVHKELLDLHDHVLIQIV